MGRHSRRVGQRRRVQPLKDVVDVASFMEQDALTRCLDVKQQDAAVGTARNARGDVRVGVEFAAHGVEAQTSQRRNSVWPWATLRGSSQAHGRRVHTEASGRCRVLRPADVGDRLRGRVGGAGRQFSRLCCARCSSPPGGRADAKCDRLLFSRPKIPKSPKA